jgi:hypothetical protein
LRPKTRHLDRKSAILAKNDARKGGFQCWNLIRQQYQNLGIFSAAWVGERGRRGCFKMPSQSPHRPRVGLWASERVARNLGLLPKTVVTLPQYVQYLLYVFRLHAAIRPRTAVRA